MSDHEFDALFKKAADNLEVPYNPQGWKRMQTRLNHSGNNGFLKRGLWGLGAFLLLLAAVWWLSEVWMAEARQAKVISLSATHEITMKEALPKVPDPKEKIVLKANRPSEEKEVENNEMMDQSESKLASKPGRVDERNEPGSTALGLTSIQKPEAIYLLQSQGIKQETWQQLAYFPEQVEVKKVEQPSVARPDMARLIAVQPLEVIKTERSPDMHRWGLSFALSPDLSGIGLQNISQVGTKANVQLEFFVLPNVSISSGINFAVKTYSASPEDYHQKYQYNRKPVGINGQCKVLDIPLNLRWYALNGARSRVFVSGGLSSYMMLSEDYEYVYQAEGGYDGYTRNYAYKNENNHLFKVANFSVGYEHALGKQWAVQAEPFVKLPLAGVGEGEIKLSTLGAFLSVHYRWGRR